MVRLVVDGEALLGQRSGIGRYTAGLLEATARTSGAPDVAVVLPRTGDDHQGIQREIAAWNGSSSVPGRIASRLVRYGNHLRLPVPFDILSTGGDVTLFPNYRCRPSLRPTVTMIYDLSYEVTPDCIHPDYLPRLRRYIRQAVDRSSVIGVISKTVEQEITDRFPQTRGRTLLLRPGWTRPQWTADLPASVVASLGISPGFMLFVGALEPRKNLVALTEAVKRMPPDLIARHPLVLVGPPGWNNDRILSAIAATPQVRHLNYVTDVTLGALYSMAALVVYPSRYEGFGLPVLEAMAHGVPVACSDIAVLREVGGNDVRYFDHLDASSIADALTQLLEDPAERARLGDAGRARARGFTWAEAGQALAATAQQLAGSARTIRDLGPS